MGLPLLHVLAAEPWHEGAPQPGVNVLKVRTGNCECDTRPEMTKATDLSCDWRAACRNLDKMLDNLLPVFAGQTMKHRQVSCEEVSIRRKVLLTKSIKWLEVAVGNAGRQDERLKGFQDTKPSLRVSDIVSSVAAKWADCETAVSDLPEAPGRSLAYMVGRVATFVGAELPLPGSPLCDMTHRVAFWDLKSATQIDREAGELSPQLTPMDWK
jgi:hypothetical protein